jgi:hypothetical protein
MGLGGRTIDGTAARPGVNARPPTCPGRGTLESPPPIGRRRRPSNAPIELVHDFASGTRRVEEAIASFASPGPTRTPMRGFTWDARISRHPVYIEMKPIESWHRLSANNLRGGLPAAFGAIRRPAGKGSSDRDRRHLVGLSSCRHRWRHELSPVDPSGLIVPARAKAAA